jgi:glycosyltransferase 2 family protein
VRWGFAAACVGICGYSVARQWNEIRSALAGIGVLAVAGALLSVLLALLAAMQVWRLMLAALGSALPAPHAARVVFVGQLAKYAPGSVWPVLAQMELGSAYRVPRHRSATASLLTPLISVLCGLLAALVTLPFVAGARSYWWVLLAVPFLLACLHPKVLNSVLGLLSRLTRRPPPEEPLTVRTVATCLAWSAGSWVCYGLQIWLLSVRLGAPRADGLLLAIGSFSLAWCAGFVAVFVPAGAGIREVVLVALLAPAIGVGAATAVALVSRALTTVSDLLTAGAASGYSWWWRSGDNREGPEACPRPAVPESRF